MATIDTSNPCATEERAGNDSLERERIADEAHTAAWKSFNSDAVRKMVSSTDFSAIRNRLTVGKWPDALLGNLSSPEKTTFERYAQAVYAARTAVDETREAASADRDALIACKHTPEYLEWVTSQAQGGDEGSDSGSGADSDSGSRTRCGKPRVGHGSKGKQCQVPLGKDGACQYHG